MGKKHVAVQVQYFTVIMMQSELSSQARLSLERVFVRFRHAYSWC